MRLRVLVEILHGWLIVFFLNNLLVLMVDEGRVLVVVQVAKLCLVLITRISGQLGWKRAWNQTVVLQLDVLLLLLLIVCRLLSLKLLGEALGSETLLILLVANCFWELKVFDLKVVRLGTLEFSSVFLLLFWVHLLSRLSLILIFLFLLRNALLIE